MSSEPHVLIKGGMFYGHNSCGYVSNVLMAELFDERFAKNQEKSSDGEIRALPVTDFLRDSDYIQEVIDRLEVMRDLVSEKSD